MERDDSRARCALPTLCTTQVGHRVLSAELDRKAVGTISSKLVFLISVPIAASANSARYARRVRVGIDNESDQVS